ncbi:MAG: hypothetical protein ABI927_08775 [Gaiellaceae bacterium]
MRQRRWAFVLIAFAIVVVAAVWTALARVGSRRSTGGWIAFIRGQTSESDRGRVYLIRPDGSRQRRLGPFAATDLSWSPNGRKLAFVTHNKRFDRIWIDVVDRDGSHLRRVTPARWLQDCFSIMWSPDSRRLALTRVRDCEGDTAIYVLNADGTHLHRLAGPSAAARAANPTDSDPAMYSLNPAWSPDATRILFTRGFGDERLFLMRADGSGARPVADIHTFSGGGLPRQPPAWSRNGHQIFFLSADHSLFRSDLDGSHTRLLSPPSLDVRGFVLSPDRTRILLDAALGYRRSIYLVNSDGSHFEKRTDNIADCCPTWSPDGRQIVFARNLSAHDNSQIYVMKTDGSDLDNLSHNRTSDHDPAWAPSGLGDSRSEPHLRGTIAFTRGADRGSVDGVAAIKADGSGFHLLAHRPDIEGPLGMSPDGRILVFMMYWRGGGRLYAVNVDGSGLHRITGPKKDEDDINPAWSPNGRRLVFDARGDGWSDLSVVNMDGSGERTLVAGSYATGSAVLAGGDAWSPDGRKIVYADPRGNLAVMRPDGSHRRRLEPQTSASGGASWSPNGKKLVLNAGGEIALVNADGTRLRRIASRAEYPVWSPDGGKIAFVRNGGVFVINSDGSGLRKVGRSGDRASWSPDGNWLVYASYRNGPGDIYLVKEDGSHERQLTDTKLNEAAPVWSPAE